MKINGRISVYHASRGFGFIHRTEADGRLLTYFFHIKEVKTGDPMGGKQVRFTPSENQKGLTATDIEVAEQAVRP